MKPRKQARNLLTLLAFLAIPVSGFASYVASIVPPGQSAAAPTNFVGRSVNVMDFGAQCNAATGTGNMSAGSNMLTMSGIPSSALLDNIVVSGAANWTLNGYVNSGSNIIFNVGYTTPCPSCAGGVLLYPSLLGATGGAMITSDTASVITGNQISTEYWGTPDTGTFTLATTGSWNSLAPNNLIVTTASAPLVGQNGQIVQVASGTNNGVFTPLTLMVQKGMVVNTVSSHDISNDVVTGVSGTTITLATALTGSNAGEAITIGGQFSPYVIVMLTNASGMVTAQPDLFTIPGAPLATTITGVSGGITLGANATNPVPGWVATNVSILAGFPGSGYSPGDFIVVKDGDTLGTTRGTTLQVTATGPTGTISPGGVNVYAQALLTSQPPASAQQYLFSSGGGSLAQFVLSYTKTGQFWYGTDDSSAINLALSGGVNFTLSGATMNTRAG